MMVTRLEDVARELGFEVTIPDPPAESEQAELRPVPLTEPTAGADALFMRELVDRRPALILIDLTARGYPWGRWVQILKTSAATRRIPVLAFGPHVESENLKLAQQLGADRVVSRGKFRSSMRELIERTARRPEASDGCRGDVSDKAAQGIELANAGEFYESHELLEQAWMAAQGAEGALYRSMLQLVVAYLHVERGNFAGAAKMLLRLRQWLDPLPDSCRRVDVSALKLAAQELDAELQRLGSDRMEQVDPSLLRPIRYTSPARS